jgi:hypothetical protein
MDDRRSEHRLLCADLVEVEWKDKNGRKRRQLANLEDISPSGACLQLDTAVPLHTKIQIAAPGGDMEGVVRYCVYREIGYFLGVQFEGTRWSKKDFTPQHLFDPRRLISKEQTDKPVRRARAS